MLLSIILTTLLFRAWEDPYVLILTNNKQMTVAGAPQCSGNLCKVLLLTGEYTSLPSRMIDLERTRLYNEEQAQLREAAAQVRAEAEKAAADAEAEAALEEKTPEIKLSRYEMLPVSDPGLNALVSIETAAENLATGQPRSKNFTSSDPIYVAFEQVTPFQTDYEILCDLKTNEVGGVQNVNVRMKVIYSEGLPEEAAQTVATVNPGQTARLSFRVRNSGEIVQIGYTIDYDVLKNE